MLLVVVFLQIIPKILVLLPLVDLIQPMKKFSLNLTTRVEDCAFVKQAYVIDIDLFICLLMENIFANRSSK